MCFKNDFESIFVGIRNYNMSLLDYLKVKKPNGIEDGKKVRWNDPFWFN